MKSSILQNKRLVALVLSLFLFASLMTGFSVAWSVDSTNQPAPTLVPPTLLPTVDAGAFDALLSESTIARIMREGKVRVGLLFNAPPFGELNIRGEVAGFDADLARNLAETWGVTFEPVQVTRQTGLELLKNGAIDMLVAAQPHRRELDAQVEFSQTYYGGSQAMLVRKDDGAASLADMANRKIGVVLGKSGEGAVSAWQRYMGISITVQSYLLLDQAFAALMNGEVDGVVDNRIELGQLIATSGAGKILEEAVAPEPYAIALRRQDVNFRNLVNRTLQYLVKNGKLNEIHKANFAGAPYDARLLPIWANLGDEAPRPDQFSQDVPYPSQYALPRVQAAGVIRVAGVTDLSPEATESEKRLATLNRAVIEAMASRWQVRVEYIPNSAANAADLVANGQADIAVGVPLDWSLTDRVDLTGYYLLHGERMMVKENSDFETFNSLRGRWVGVFASEPGAADRVNALAESVSVGVRIFTILREPDAAIQMLEDASADVVFGDSLKLIPHIQANPGVLRLSTRGDAPDPWYSRVYTGLAVPRNDIDFRLLVEYSLQEVIRDGTLVSLLQPVMLPEEIPPFDSWPGPSEYLDFILTG